MKMRLSLRRFPDTITRVRTTGRRVNGLWVDNPPVETTHRASVQPISLEDEVERDGARLTERVRAYVPEESVLRAADDEQPTDEVTWFKRRYKVERSESWGKYTQAVLFRET